MNSSAPFNCIAQSDLLLQIWSEAKLPSHLLQFVVLALLYLYFHLVADTELVLDVLRASETTEDAATNHDTELGRKSLGLFHRVSRQNNSRFLVSLGDLLDDLPHEPPSFRVHTSRWLIKQNNGWVSEQCHRDRQLSLVAT